MNSSKNFKGKKGLKLNLGCGRNVKDEFINVDLAERENELDLICDLSETLPFDDESCEYIYSEHFIEHLTWLDGLNFLGNCFRCLKPGGRFRLVFPDFAKVFNAYLTKDSSFFDVFKQGLNEEDYSYYQSVYQDPEEVKRIRSDKPPPKWHVSRDPDDRKRLKHRIRKFDYQIDLVEWFVHQFGEHNTLYDEESIEGKLKEIGFSDVRKVNFLPGMDSDAPSRINSSIYIEAVK